MQIARTSALALALLSLAPGSVRAAETAPAQEPQVTQASAVPAGTRDLVATVVADGRFTKLAAALVAAGLDEALRGAGPFTVFAPTDDAFGRVPAADFEDLLRPESRDRLKSVLGFHVVAGRVLASDLLPKSSVPTLAGTSLPLRLRVGAANVEAADIHCTNGVIHVIDQVLLPPEAPAAGIVRKAVERGVPLFNGGDPAACAAVYEEAARALMALPANDLGIVDRADVAKALAVAPADATERAWAFRRVMDRVLDNEQFRPLIEAPMPVGYPGPGPLGRVVEKSYPAVRAARAEGGRASFWTLFQHIQKNEIAMTTPVEMTMDDGMRMERMAFLYEDAARGAAGQDGAVAVTDSPAVTVLSVAMRGTDDAASVALAKSAIEERAAAGGWKRAGAWRMLGYNSPMVPAARRTWELQLPVTR